MTAGCLGPTAINAWLANWNGSPSTMFVGGEGRGRMIDAAPGKRLHGTMGCLFDGSFWFGGSGDGGANGMVCEG